MVCQPLLEIQQFSKYDLKGRKYKLTSQISDILIKRRKIFHASVGKANATHSQSPLRTALQATIHTQWTRQILKPHRVSESWRARGLKTDRLQGLTARASRMVALGWAWKSAFLTGFHMMGTPLIWGPHSKTHGPKLMDCTSAIVTIVIFQSYTRYKHLRKSEDIPSFIHSSRS